MNSFPSGQGHRAVSEQLGLKSQRAFNLAMVLKKNSKVYASRTSKLDVSN